ncbi:MAG TPA: penicillin acylase family protein [Thermoleophilaceae bacterium]|nr:penicillin acylase family protein [Thermoleophilaceae bacterium]
MPARGAIAALAAALALLAAAPAAHARGTYWNLLGVGQGETVDAVEFATSTGTEEPPPSFVNQRDLFNALLPAGPNVRTRDLHRFFKPAPLSPPTTAAPEIPKPGVTIRRDAYKVPFVTGTTRADTMFGAGYAAATDRLFLMDVLRHAARSRLTELAGPGAGNENLIADVKQLDVTDYTEADLQTMFSRLKTSQDSEERQVATDTTAYVAGINAYIADARNDPTKMPAEYGLLNKPLNDWKATDSIAIFGLGGGRSADAAMALQEAIARFGPKRGRRVLNTFRNLDDPEAPVTTTRRFPFDDPGRPTARATALLDRSSYQSIRRVQNASEATSGKALVTLRLKRHASNAMVIPGARSTSGNPLMVAGPQVDFYSPEIFNELSLKGPGIDARGVALPGLAPYVLIGRGTDFTWSITTAQGDLADEFAEKLCANRDKYLYKGRCIPFAHRTRTLHWEPGPADLALDPNAKPVTYTVTSKLSVHGPVVGTATTNGRPVAITLARSSFRHEAESGVGLMRMNQPQSINGPRDFQHAAARLTGSYNFFYADEDHAAYLQSGWYPRRARHTDPTLPTWGTGQYDWKGFDPSTFTSKRLGYARLPKDADPPRGYLVSWNNKQAPGWRASDADWEYGPVHRSQRLEHRVRAALRNNGKLSLGQLVGIMGDAGTVDLRGQEVLPWLLKAIGKPRDHRLARLTSSLARWHARGAHRRDRDGDGYYDSSLPVALMDAWWTPMVHSLYDPVLGRRLTDRIAAINQIDYTPRMGPDTWFYGWMSYVHKDLRAVLHRHPRRPPAILACGRGNRAACRKQLRATLLRARARLIARYGSLDAIHIPATCPVTDPPSCDQLDFIAAGAIETPPIPWQDRGTFQQAAEPGAP